MRLIISKTTSSGGGTYLRKSRESRGADKRQSEKLASDSQEADSADGDRAVDNDQSAGDVVPAKESQEVGAQKDPIATAIDQIRQMDPETLTNLARAFLKPAQATG